MARLQRVEEGLRCVGSTCSGRFPIVDGVPVLLNESESVFSVADYLARCATTVVENETSRLSSLLWKCVPPPGRKIRSRQNLEKFGSLLMSQSTAPKVLIIGGRVAGRGMEQLLDNPAIHLVETDVAFGPRTMLICDGQKLPFESGSFDGVVGQAVLEHIIDPYKCVEEIHRVLKGRGLVYAETPFMVPGHFGRYDFTRFTHLGHRRLFRWFDEIDSGAISGPGVALAWAYRHFSTSFSESDTVRKFVGLFAVFTSFFLKYLDSLLIDKAGAIDAAAILYFLGRKSDAALPDRELLKRYRGAGCF
jgi:SAM-dependent methyltransferase